MTWYEQIEKALEIGYKYELHAFVLIISGAVMAICGQRDIGFAIVTAGTTIFKNKAAA